MDDSRSEENDLLRRSIRVTEFLLGLLLGIGFLTLQWRMPAAIVFGGAWSVVNLFLLKSLAPVVLGRGKRPKLRLVLLLLVKFPLLYFVGWFLVAQSGLSPLGLIAGFSLPLFVMTGSALFERGKERFQMQVRRG
ncbi:MAG TPA: hypothetical protein VFG95_02505 [Nitrospiria bacterium]|nr:hypothetical protein [Nitrospiria bacterium]